VDAPGRAAEKQDGNWGVWVYTQATPTEF
jgi:hypothetical protein